jgi:hypothetical protein
MMRIDTENYEASHGRKPRGDGYWFFFIKGRDGEAIPYMFTGGYGNACKAVKAEAKLIGRASGIVLCA